MKIPPINSPIYPLAAIVAAGVVLYFGGKKLLDVVPNVVKEGAEAVGVLGGAVLRGISDPADAFGITPRTYEDGTPTWTPTVPWESPDPVSNNDSGVNWNLF